MSDTSQRDPALDLFVVLSRAYTWVNAHAIRDIRCHGLNPTEFGILEALYHKGPLPLQQIGEKVLISSGNITYAIDKLEQKQLLVRKPSVHDRRVIFAELTPQGQELLAISRRTATGHSTPQKARPGSSGQVLSQPVVMKIPALDVISNLRYTNLSY